MIGWVPVASDAVARVACPPERFTVPIGVTPSVNITVPVGVPATEATVAVSETVPPNVDGFALLVTLVVVTVPITDCVRAALVLAR